MAAPKQAKKAPAFKLDVETRFEVSGRGKVTWFKLLEEDDYEKIGGNFYPDDTNRIGGVVADLLAEAQEQCDEAGIDVTQVDPIKADKDGNNFYKINRKATKADGSAAVIQFKDHTGKKPYDFQDELGNGSVVAIKYYASAYYMARSEPAPGIVVPARIGVSLSPLVIQVIDHKVYISDDDGFECEDGEMSNEDEGTTEGKNPSGDSDDY